MCCDVLLILLSEEQLRRHGLVAGNTSYPVCVDHGGLTPDESHVSQPCALVPQSGEQINGSVEEDMLESIVPLSGHDGCTCT